MFTASVSIMESTQEEIDAMIAPYPVHSLWQCTYVAFLWAQIRASNYFLDALYNANCSGHRLKNIESESRRFKKYNKPLIYNEYEKIRSLSLNAMKNYFETLMKMKHYLLAFNVSDVIIQREHKVADAILLTMLNLLDY